MSLLAALLLLTGLSADQLERVTPEVAAERVAQCGAGSATIRYDDELQSHILSVATAAQFTEAQLDCIDRAASYHMVELPPAAQTRFDAIREARFSAIFDAKMRADLAAKGLLDRVPKYVDGVTDKAAFARQVEALCGPRAKGAFDSRYDYRAISPDWIRAMRWGKDDDVLGCIISSATVAGSKIGFIGNEAVADD